MSKVRKKRKALKVSKSSKSHKASKASKSHKSSESHKASKTSKDSFDRRLRLLRRDIDRVDRQVLAALQRRFRIVAKVGHLKRQGRRSIVQNQREVEVLRNRSQIGANVGLRKSFIRGIFEMILAEAAFQQKKAPSLKKSRRNEVKVKGQ
ncbi:MAG: chorismate mutase [Bdellovibrionales bacterium]|nr:chorismate mutase [Bdellovibrionales bacterium]